MRKASVLPKILVAIAVIILIGGGTVATILIINSQPDSDERTDISITRDHIISLGDIEEIIPKPTPTPYNTTTPFTINDIIIVNKKHPLPQSYSPGENPEASAQLRALITAGRAAGVDIIFSWSGFRSYDTQANLFNSYAAEFGVANAETFSARPGYSEHQTGLAFDLISSSGQLYRVSDNTYDYNTDWVAQNAAEFGFIVRYRSDWQSITGFIGEPWHLRYLGVDLAKQVFASNLPLETFLKFEGGDYSPQS